MLVDENGCHPPKDHQTTFKYPECMDTLSIETNVALYGFDEESTDDMYEPEDAIDETYVLMAMNRSCFQTVPTLGDGCVFEIADEDFDGSTLLGTKQVLIRFVCFMVIEHVQFTVIMLMSRRNDDKSTSTKRSGEVHRLHQVGCRFVRYCGLPMIQVLLHLDIRAPYMLRGLAAVSHDVACARSTTLSQSTCFLRRPKTRFTFACKPSAPQKKLERNC